MYEQLSNKEDTFLAAYDHLIELTFAQSARPAPRARPGPTESAWRSRRQAILAKQPALARLCVIDVLAGPTALARHLVTMERFQAFSTPAYEQTPENRRAPELTADAVIGRIYQTIYIHVGCGKAVRLPALFPALPTHPRALRRARRSHPRRGARPRSCYR